MKAIVLSMAMSGLLAVSVFADPPATAPSAPPPTTVPTTSPTTQPAVTVPAMLRGPLDVIVNGQFEVQRRNARTQQQIYESQPVAGTFHLEGVVRFTLLDGFLRADFGPSELPTGQTVFKVDGFSSTWMARTNVNAGLRTGRYVNINKYDFDQLDEGQIWHASLSCSDAYLMLNAVGIGFTIGYQQANGIVGFSVMKFENGRNRPLYYFNAPSLLRLQADHPEEVRQFLAPLFRCWMIQDLLKPGATDVYGVFTELEPPAAIVARVAEILPRLDRESFPDRDTASQDLAKLGSAGVQVAMRIDRGRLSFEQSDRIDAFIDRHRRRLAEDPKAMRGQIDFLLDCLEDEDASVRAASKAAIEKVMGHAVRFDVAINGIDRADAVDELRKALKQERDAKAATQPS